MSTENDQPETNHSREQAAAPDSTPTNGDPPGDPSLQTLQEQAAKAGEYWDKLVRLSADFDNYKKRVARERGESARYANASLLHQLLPVLDNLDMALAAVGDSSESNAQSLKAGVEMVFQQFKRVLIEAGLEEIDAAAQSFDPNIHEAVSQQESPDVPEGHVAQQLRKGYKLHDRLLRPASVIVAKAPFTGNDAPAGAGAPHTEEK